MKIHDEACQACELQKNYRTLEKNVIQEKAFIFVRYIKHKKIKIKKSEPHFCSNYYHRHPSVKVDFI